MTVGNGPFIASGSDIVQSVVLEAASIVNNVDFRNNQLISLNNISYNSTTSRLALDIPHAVLSFTVSKNNMHKCLFDRFYKV